MFRGKLHACEGGSGGSFDVPVHGGSCQWRTAVWRDGDPTIGNKGKWVRIVRHPQELLGGEGEVGGLIGGGGL
jgi:hypothetical protein